MKNKKQASDKPLKQSGAMLSQIKPTLYIGEHIAQSGALELVKIIIVMTGEQDGIHKRSL